MKSKWNDAEAAQLNGDLLKLRVYTSRLLGQEEDLVLHGGGNTSVKIREKNIFGESEDILYVKGSGWDLATIEAPGFAPVKLDPLLQLARLESLSDPDMVKYQRMAMTDPSAPNPSVEAILHAIIPFVFVDHTHTDAVVTISNTPGGEARLRELYGPEVLILPFVMPGFILARQIYDLTKELDWSTIKGIVLMHHGVFTFHDDARIAYENMIDLVHQAEEYLAAQGAHDLTGQAAQPANALTVARLRREVSNVWGTPVLATLDASPTAVAFSNLPDLRSVSGRGPLTPDHIIRTKRTPAVLGDSPLDDIQAYARAYVDYFTRHNPGDLTQLDPAPRWALWPGHGKLMFGTSPQNIRIIRDISRHTERAIYQAEHLGGWTTLPQAELFEMEYWVLEQAKLKKAGSSKPLQGKIALVTGAASGIGKAAVQRLVKEGAVVAALDINPDFKSVFPQKEVLCISCDVTDTAGLQDAIRQTVLHFGGLDLLVSNAGIFPKSHTLAEMDGALWNQSLEINLTAHQRLLQYCIPYLELGFSPAVVIVGSKNVPAPGPGAGAYSVAKAGLTQMARVAALELGAKGIRINTIHPNSVYDTGIWTEEVLQARAKHYGLSVAEYKANNILKAEVTSHDVAELIFTLLGSAFSKITGAQIPIDGGNERVI
ncbi:MAG: bifunctional aldolase/short-chain dehydrogenase [Bacteroidia bacterium]|nr:bifunctional aldolase/short-chain dehydrogenase [Bacteroidia bacterium]